MPKGEGLASFNAVRALAMHDEQLKNYRIDATSGCWIWLGSTNQDGSGKVKRNGKTIRAHRLFYECLVGPISDDWQIVRSCENVACVNPEHLSVFVPKDPEQCLFADVPDSLPRPKPIPRLANDLTGKQINSYLVLYYVGPGKHLGARWLCKCVCGVYKITVGAHLLSGKVKSCGCYSRALARQGNAPGESLKKRLIKRYKKNASKRNLEWNLLDEYAIELFSGNCTYCDAPPSMGMRESGSPDVVPYNSIDRILNHIGYFPGNVASCCDICNRAKSDMPIEKWLDWLERVRDRKLPDLRRKIGKELAMLNIQNFGWMGDAEPAAEQVA